MKKRLLIDNKSCILVEFSNEEEALAIGYTCWLNETVTEEELNNIIESKKEVEIVWPKCDVQSARKMKTILKGLTDWEVHAVKVLGFGDWTNMSAELDSLRKNNVLCTTKQNRHLIMKKSFDDTEYAMSTSKTDKSIKKSDKNEKQLLRKVEAQKRSGTILNEILKTNKNTKIDDDELENTTSESESATSEEPIIKKCKSQLQTDLTILRMENKKLKEEVAHYRNISYAQNEAKKLLVDLRSSRTVLDEIHFVCFVCHNVQGSYLGMNKVSPLKQKKVLSGNFKNDLELISESNEFKKCDPDSSLISQKYVRSEVSKEVKTKNEKPFKKMCKNTYSSSMINTLEIDDAHLSDCHNVNDADENISSEVKNIKLNNNSENLLKSIVLQSELKGTSDKLTKLSDDSQSDLNMTSNTLTKPLDNTENSLLMDLGYGVKICRSILEEVRKKNVRHLLLDLLNALYTKADFASCSRSGKKGKSVETAKPELDTNKQKAIADYAVKILPEKSKEEIEVLLKKLIENKCKNAGKQNKPKEVPLSKIEYE